jgi:hypothetical protein
MGVVIGGEQVSSFLVWGKEEQGLGEKEAKAEEEACCRAEE